jgi:hypothetical protein
MLHLPSLVPFPAAHSIFGYLFQQVSMPHITSPGIFEPSLGQFQVCPTYVLGMKWQPLWWAALKLSY